MDEREKQRYRQAVEGTRRGMKSAKIMTQAPELLHVHVPQAQARCQTYPIDLQDCQNLFHLSYPYA